MKHLATLAPVIVLFIAEQSYAGPRRHVYPVYPAYPYHPRVIVAPILVRPANALANYPSRFIPGNAAPAVPQFERFIRLENHTGAELNVFLLYRTRDPQGRWAWLPDDPSGDRAMTFVLEPGKSLDLTGKVSASRLRVWAESPTQKWHDHRNNDLLLVPEPEGMYLSSRLETFTHAFGKNATPARR